MDVPDTENLFTIENTLALPTPYETKLKNAMETMNKNKPNEKKEVEEARNKIIMSEDANPFIPTVVMAKIHQ